MEREIKINDGNYIENNYGDINFNKSNNEENSKNDKWFTQWWFISLGVSCISTIISYLVFNNMLISIVTFVITYFVMVSFNPKKRFFRLALVCFTLIAINSYGFKFLHSSEAFFISVGGNSVPWANIIYAIIAIVLLVLDYKNNKK